MKRLLLRRGRLLLFCFITLSFYSASCNEAIEPRPTEHRFTAADEMERCPVEDPDCDIHELSEDGRQFVERSMTHIDLSKGPVCLGTYQALSEALSRNRIKEWTKEYLIPVDSTGRLGVLTGDMHARIDTTYPGLEEGDVHLWSGLWDGRIGPLNPWHDPETTPFHEGVHRHTWLRLGDLTSHHAEMPGYIQDCWVQWSIDSASVTGSLVLLRNLMAKGR